MNRRHGGSRPAAAAAVTVLLVTAAAGCSVGPGAPDGWRYVRAGTMAVALPKTWRVTADGPGGLRAELPGSGPGTAPDAALAVTPALPVPAVAAPPAAHSRTAPAHPAGGTPPGAATPPLVPVRPVPADARRQTPAIDGSRARVFSFARPAPDGRPAAHVEVRLHDPAGRAVTLRAWAVDGAAHDPALLQEIVNSIEFPGR